jgi:hypothetical protein
MIGMKVRTKSSGIFKTGIPAFHRALHNACEKITAGIMKESAKEYIKKKKFVPKFPSFVFQSFSYTVSSTPFRAIGVVTAGGPRPKPGYWAIYLNYDRVLPNGKMWSEVNPNAPYLFMEAGEKKGAQIAKGIVKAELKKVGFM